MRFPGFIGPSYTLQSVNVDCQSCVNLFPEINALGTGKEREVAALVPTPGLLLLLTFPQSPTRALWTASNGEVYAVAGSKFYIISSDWIATEIGSLSTDHGYVSIADNGIHVVIVDGSFGYSWGLVTRAFSQISDPNFPGADQVTFQDGYFIFNKPNTQQFFISGLYAVTFRALDIGTAEGLPDSLIGVISNNQNLYLFGSKSTEVFYDSGDPAFPFARIQGAVNDVGCSAPFSIAKMAGTLFWLGGDSTGTGIVYKMQGYQAVRISTSAIESVIRKLSSAQIAQARAYTYQQGGHLFYCLNLPGTKSTWVYDASTEFWHERTYLNLWSQERHRSECHTIAFGRNIVGDYANGNLYALDANTSTDNGTSISRDRVIPHMSGGLKLIRHNSFQLDIEAGVGLDGIAQGTDPVAMLRWSDDGGHRWSEWHEASIGKIGKYGTRVIWRRLGRARDRVYHVRITDPVKVVLLGAELNIEAGVS